VQAVPWLVVVGPLLLALVWEWPDGQSAPASVVPLLVLPVRAPTTSDHEKAALFIAWLSIHCTGSILEILRPHNTAMDIINCGCYLPHGVLFQA
jgi:hypothetical protein